MRTVHLAVAGLALAIGLAFSGCCMSGSSSPLPFPMGAPVPAPTPVPVPPVVLPPPPVPAPVVMPLPPPPGVAGAAPSGWPEGFPVVPGGTPMPVPPAGPVRVAVLAYGGTTTDALDASYHAQLAAAGWTATATEAGPEAHRFTATRGATSVSVSIYGEGGQTFIQTMQMLF